MQLNEILFHKPYLSQEASHMMQDALKPDNSLFKEKCHTLNQQLIKEIYEPQEVVFTSSCTAALKLASLLLKLKAGDEVIIPSYTFPSVANVFANRGIRIRLADSLAHHPNLDAGHARTLINDKTRKHFRSVYLPHTDKFSDRLLRLPLYPDLGEYETNRVCLSIKTFYNQ